MAVRGRRRQQESRIENARGRTVGLELELVVKRVPVADLGVVDQLLHMDSRLPLVHLRLEPVLQPDHRPFARVGRQLGPFHQLAGVDDFLAVRSGGEVGLDDELLELAVSGRFEAAHDVDHLERQLERGSFEVDATGTDVEEKTEIDVGDVPVAVDHHVAVVSVADLEQVAENRVGGHGPDEGDAGALEGLAVLGTELSQEEGLEVVDLGSTHLITRGRVRNDVDDTALRRSRSVQGSRGHGDGRTPGAVAVTRYGTRCTSRETLS